MSDNNNNTISPTTAGQAYARHAARIASDLGWLEDELDAHAAKQRADPGNWGRVGDLAELEALLKRALGHASGMEPDRVDDALADLEARQGGDDAKA